MRLQPIFATKIDHGIKQIGDSCLFRGSKANLNILLSKTKKKHLVLKVVSPPQKNTDN